MLSNLLKPFGTMSSRIAKRQRIERKRVARRAVVERLERREVLANYIVLNTADSGPGSLRAAIELANGNADADVIEFNLPAGPQTIQLQSTLSIEQDVSIVGPGAANLTIDGGNEVRLFEITEAPFDTLTVSISGVTLQRGNAGEGAGGAINNQGGELFITDSVLRNNRAVVGGAIYALNEIFSDDGFTSFQSAEVYISRSTLSQNSATESGGAIFNLRGHVEISDGSSLVNNTAVLDGGAVYTIGVPNSNDTASTLIVNNSTFSGNIATEGSGGAVYAVNDHVEFTDSTVSSNRAALDGGAIYTINTNSTPLESLLTFNTSFSANIAGDRGGAIYSTGDRVELNSSTLTGNRAVSGGAVYTDFNEFGFSSFGAFDSTFEGNIAQGGTEQDGRGGAIFHTGSSFFTIGLTFRNNQAIGGTGGSGRGGAIYSDQYFEVQDSTFTSNSASVGNSQGGAIWSQSASERSAFLSHLTFSGNSANQGGALFMDNRFFLQYATLDGNRALAGSGGAIWSGPGFDSSNATIHGNSATRDGGGIYIDTGVAGTTLNGLTITDNRADSDGTGDGSGGGIANFGDLQLFNTITAGNLVGSGSVRSDILGAVQSSSSGNLISVSTELSGIANASNLNQIGTASTPIDPLLGPLTNNGGRLRTRALLNGSPAFDSGNDQFRLFSDQRDDFRQQTFTTRRVGRVDIGAFERVLDYGDATASYPVLASANGASHEMSSGLRLGRAIDNEVDGLPTANASGDNFNRVNDEDGIAFRFITADFMARAEVTASGAGLLSGWFDLNRDGDWDDAGEQIVSDRPVVAGVNLVDYSITGIDFGAATAIQTFARFRLSTQPGLTVRGTAPDGEVEDYVVRIEKVVLPDASGGPGGGFTFNTQVVAPRVPRGYDPLWATGYDYAVQSGPKFATLELPPGYGDDEFNAIFVDGLGNTISVPFTAGEELDFEFGLVGGQSVFDGVSGGVTSFRIDGIELSEQVDATSNTAFLTILSFATAGTVNFTQTPISVFVALNDTAATQENSTLTVSAPGVLSNDTYTGAVLTVTEVGGVAANVGQATILPSGASVQLNSDGSYIYDPRTAFDYLPDGVTAIDSFTYKVNDGTRTSIATVTVTVTGQNDAATIGGTATGALAEDATVSSASGGLTIVDVDQGQANFVAGTLAGTYGAFTFNNATGAWTYTLDNTRAATTALADGQVVTDSLSVSSADGSDSEVIVVTITGANDAAAISGTTSGAVTEDSATGTASGDLNVLDVDSPINFQAPASLAGVYGSFTFDASTGGWTYTLNNSDPDTNALAAGQTVSDKLTVVSSDGTATADVIITVTGANDAATISGASTGTVTEDAAVSTVSGALAVSDVDSPQTFQTPTGLAGVYGNFTFNPTTGAWQYSLNNSDPDTNALAAGQTVHELLTVRSSDGTASRTIDITIVGASDTVVNTAPIASITGPTTAVRGQEVSFTVSAEDSVADKAVGFVYRIRWGDGSPDTIINRTANNGAGVRVNRTFAASGTFRIEVTATDQANATSAKATRNVTVTPVAVQADPANSGSSALFIGGTNANDAIEVSRSFGQTRVKLNGVNYAYTNSFSSIYVFGQAGKDKITVASSVTTPAFLFGGDGDDCITAGSGRTVIVGGAGNDSLYGGQSRDILIGGLGRDVLYGSGDGDILIGATTVHDNDIPTLASIAASWNSSQSYQTRITGLSSRLNASTVIDDAAADILWGSSGLDWYFAERRKTTRDSVFASWGETITSLT